MARLEKALKLKNTSKINGKKVPHKLSSKYLGSFITHDGTSIKEAKFRIARARKKFNSMFVLWKSKRLTKSHKYKLYTGVLAQKRRTIIKLSFCAQTEQLASAQVKGTKEHPTSLRNAGAPLSFLPSRAGLRLARVVPRALGCEARAPLWSILT